MCRVFKSHSKLLWSVCEISWLIWVKKGRLFPPPSLPPRWKPFVEFPLSFLRRLSLQSIYVSNVATVDAEKPPVLFLLILSYENPFPCLVKATATDASTLVSLAVARLGVASCFGFSVPLFVSRAGSRSRPLVSSAGSCSNTISRWTSPTIKLKKENIVDTDPQGQI